MKQLFCDRCKKQIREVEGDLTVFEVSIKKRVEKGKAEKYEDHFAVELCADCVELIVDLVKKRIS